MNYHAIKSPDMLNGPGLRTVLWVSGCTNNCPGCHNPGTHPFKSGKLFTPAQVDEILTELRYDYISGLTITGGDPLHPRNLSEVSDLISLVRAEFKSTKSIWIYSGYTLEDLVSRDHTDESYYYLSSVLANSDVLVDGKFEINLKDPNLHFKGSSNQRVINLKESIITKSEVTKFHTTYDSVLISTSGIKTLDI